MTEELGILWTLHGLDERLAALNRLLAQYPGQRKLFEERLTTERLRLEALKREIGESQLRHRQLERDIEALVAEERKFQGQLPLVKKNEEYTALVHEIAGARERRSNRETELLVLMEAEQQMVGRKPELERALAGVEAETMERLRQLDAEERAERDEAGGIEARRGDLMDRLPRPTRSRYERIRVSRDGRAVVPIVKGACGGCFRGQAPQVMQEARRGDRVLACDGCGRLVMLPPGET